MGEGYPCESRWCSENRFISKVHYHCTHRGGADCIPCTLRFDSVVSLIMQFSSLSGFKGPR